MNPPDCGSGTGRFETGMSPHFRRTDAAANRQRLGEGPHHGAEARRARPLPAGPGGSILVQVGDFTYLHLIKDIDGERYLIGNNRGRVNGWVDRSSIYGVFAGLAERIGTGPVNRDDAG